MRVLLSLPTVSWEVVGLSLRDVINELQEREREGESIWLCLLCLLGVVKLSLSSLDSKVSMK